MSSEKLNKSNIDTKSNKKNSKLTWKEVYKKCNHNKISQVTNVLRTMTKNIEL